MSKRSVIIIIAAVVAVSLVVAASWPDGAKHLGFGGHAKKIAIIYIEGEIIGGRGTSSFMGDVGGTDGIIRQLHQARDDSTVKAIIIRMNTPGGSAPAAQEVEMELKKLRGSGKLVVTSMGDIAASGGYWIAAATDKIYANPATLTGSIGVYIPYTNWEELFRKIGISQEKIKSGPHKDILSPERPMTAEERGIIQDMVDDLYNQFIKVVADGRHMDIAKVRQLADGRIYSGSQAKELGLVDELGTLDDAIDGTAKMAGIEGKPIIKEYGSKNPWAAFFGSNSKISMESLLFEHLQSTPSLWAPLALPANW